MSVVPLRKGSEPGEHLPLAYRLVPYTQRKARFPLGAVTIAAAILLAAIIVKSGGMQ